jgi:hypothetical protein
MPVRAFIPEFAPKTTAPYLGMPPGAVWCRKVQDLPRDVEAVLLSKKSTGLEQLVELLHLRRVQGGLPADRISQLMAVPQLEHVHLSIPGSTLVPPLQGFKNLRSLVVRCNRQQPDLEFVRGMDWLHSLCISEALAVTSFEPLATLTGLRELYIDGAIRGRAAVDTLEPLASLKHLQFLSLLAKVNRGGLQPLRRLKRLNDVWLSHEYLAEDYDALLQANLDLAEIQFNGGARWTRAGYTAGSPLRLASPRTSD